MEIIGQGETQEIKLTNGDEVDTLSFATFMREHSIPWFDIAHRGTKRDLHVLTSDLRRALDPEQSSATHELALNHRQSALALEALRWVVAHDDFSPEGATGNMRRMLEGAEAQAA